MKKRVDYVNTNLDFGAHPGDENTSSFSLGNQRDQFFLKFRTNLL